MRFSYTLKACLAAACFVAASASAHAEDQLARIKQAGARAAGDAGGGIRGTGRGVLRRGRRACHVAGRRTPRALRIYPSRG